MNPIDEFMFWLMSPLGGIDGWTLLLIISLFAILFWIARHSGDDREDAKRRNQARRIR